jgi:hypothetical protein
MKRLTFFFTLLIVICGLSSCVTIVRERPASQSAFIASFSIGSIIEANEQYLIARHTVSSGTESVPPASFFQKHEEAIVQVDSTNVSAFMEAVRSDIEQALTSNGAKIHGRGGDHQGPEGSPADIAYFSFRYSEGKADGVINVWGVRGEGRSFSLIVLITES